jgi:formiminotetrahydrofolate cyclodeaminase
MLSRDELARMVLSVMAKQKEYFNPRTRTQKVLEESKALEKELRHECERILEGPTLFPEQRS